MACGRAAALAWSLGFMAFVGFRMGFQWVSMGFAWVINGFPDAGYFDKSFDFIVRNGLVCSNSLFGRAIGF
jgi:hypothetical protein